MKFRLILSIVLLLLFSGVADAQLMDSAWAKFHHDLNNSGQSPYASNSNGSLKWNFTTGNSIYGGVVVDNNSVIYFGSYDDKLYAIYPNGTLKWSLLTGGNILSTPSVDSNGIIYFGSYDGNLYAIYPNGTKKWNYTAGVISSGTSIDLNGIIYFGGSGDYKLHAIYPNGTEKWSFLTGAGIQSSPAIDLNGIIYFGSKDYKLYAIYPNGTEKWNYATGSFIAYSSPAIDSNGIIYIGSWDDKLYAIYPNGTLKWSFLTGGNVESSPAISSDGTIYVGSQDKKLYSIYPNGTEKWNYTTGGGVLSSPAIDSDGVIYVGSNLGGVFYAIYPNGSLKWNSSIGGSDYVESSPAIDSDGVIYVGSGNYKLYAFDSQAPPAPSFDPSGYVNDSLGIPIHNAFLNYTNATATRTAYSNATGYYQLINISDGTYNYNISRTGKVTQSGTIVIANGGQLKNYTLANSGTTTCTENSICQLDTNASFNLSNTSYLYGQNFNLTPTVGWDAIVEFQGLNLNISKTGSPGTITVDVYVTYTGTGFPLDIPTCTGTLLAAEVSTNFTWEMVPFGSGCTGNGSFPYILSPNSRQLVFVVSAAGVDGSNYYTFRNSTGNNFTDGTMIVNSGSGWQNVPDRDFAFELFYLQDHRPGAPTNIAPANASVNQSFNLTFSWTAAYDQDGDALTYSLFLSGGASSYSCNMQSGLTCNVSSLTPNTNYTWFVSPTDPWLIGTASANWTFRTRAPLLNLYAKWNGSDANNGESWALAFRNISYGINYSITYGVNTANTVLNIAPGNYSGDPTLTRRWLGRLKCNTFGTAQNASQIWCSYPRWNMTQS